MPVSTRLLSRSAFPMAAVVGVALLAGCTSGAGTPSTNSGGDAGGEAKVATVPGGPNPYFDSWPDGIAAAGEDFGIADTTNEVPPSITFSLDVQNSTIRAPEEAAVPAAIATTASIRL